MCRDQAIDEFEHNGLTVKVYPDFDPINPREWANIGHMVCFHRRYKLGDNHDFDPETLLEFVADDDVIALPLYLYDHSGITMNTRGFYCPWDSGMVGYIYVTKDEARKAWGKKRLSAKTRKQVVAALQSEVEVYDLYIRGAVYGFVASCPVCGKELDSCWGFYGSDYDENGMTDHIGYCDCQMQRPA